MNLKSFTAIALAASAAPLAFAGPISYGLCQTGCNGLAVSCYAAAGFTFGVTIATVPPAIVACNKALGACMATCAAIGLFAPTP